MRADAVVETRRPEADLLIAGDGDGARCGAPEDDVDADPFAVGLDYRRAAAQAEIRAIGDAELPDRGPGRVALCKASGGAGQLGDQVAVTAAGREREGERVQRLGCVGRPARASVDRCEAGDPRRGEGIVHPSLQAGLEDPAADPRPCGEVVTDAADHSVPDLAVVGRVDAHGEGGDAGTPRLEPTRNPSLRPAWRPQGR